ncbi:hypothetical protein INR49_006657 [Caranx melampygus]|nr:hypothetical protein INR49_006657 [Caranx melampygus]
MLRTGGVVYSLVSMDTLLMKVVFCPGAVSNPEPPSCFPGRVNLFPGPVRSVCPVAAGGRSLWSHHGGDVHLVQTPAPGSSDRSSPLSVRTAHSPLQSQSSPPTAGSPPCTNHVLPHSLSHPQALADAPAHHSTENFTKIPETSEEHEDAALPVLSCSLSCSKTRRPPPGPTCPPGLLLHFHCHHGNSHHHHLQTTFPVDVNEILSSAAKERAESVSSPQDVKSSKAPSLQQKSQLEELRKFGKEFRLQSSSSPSASADPPPLPHSAAPPPSSLPMLLILLTWPP